MQFIKQNMVAVASLAAGLLVFLISLPLVMGSFDSLKTKMTDSAANAQKISNLTRPVEAITIFRPDGTEEMAQVFPNEFAITQWKRRRAQIEGSKAQDSTPAMEGELQKLNNRFREIAGSNRDYVVFVSQEKSEQKAQEDYKAAIEALFQNLRPTDRPNDADVKRFFDAIMLQSKPREGSNLGLFPSASADSPSGNDPGTSPDGFSPPVAPGTPPTGTVTGIDRKNPDAVLAETQAILAANRNGRIYATREAFTYSEIIQQPGGLQREQFWYAQLGLWVQGDIVRVINRLNGQSQSVETSPVKRLLGIRFSNYIVDQGGRFRRTLPAQEEASTSEGEEGSARFESPAFGVGAGPALPPISPQGGGGGVGRPLRPTFRTPPPSAFPGETGGGQAQGPDGSLLMLNDQQLDNLQAPAIPTGRVSTDQYGVILVSTQIIIDSRAVLAFMDALTQENLYTVVNFRIDPVPEEPRFYYGQAPVVMLTLQAELLMFHDHFKDRMPPALRKFFELDSRPAPVNQ